jgi:transcriptional regulator with XRE-family HTH domain
MYETIGRRIIELRLKNGVPAKQLADLLNCSLATISNYEHAKRHIDLPDLKKIAVFFKKPMVFFLDEKLPVEIGTKIRDAIIIKALEKIDPLPTRTIPKELPLILKNALGASYVFLLLVNRAGRLQFGSSSGLNRSRMKELKALMPHTLPTTIKVALRRNVYSLFSRSRVFSLRQFMNNLRKFSFYRLYPEAPAFLSATGCKAFMSQYLLSDHVFSGFLFICFKTREKAAQWEGSNSLRLFNQYLAKRLENYLLLYGDRF